MCLSIGKHCENTKQEPSHFSLADRKRWPLTLAETPTGSPAASIHPAEVASGQPPAVVPVPTAAVSPLLKDTEWRRPLFFFFNRGCCTWIRTFSYDGEMKPRLKIKILFISNSTQIQINQLYPQQKKKPVTIPLAEACRCLWSFFGLFPVCQHL